MAKLSIQVWLYNYIVEAFIDNHLRPPFRYIPVGVLEQVPQRINHRPPAYVGRDDLETLMASNNCKDWVKIRYVQCPYLAKIKTTSCRALLCSEMLLGPVPGNFEFLPKHKANAYT